MSDHSRDIPEEVARGLWYRAAELQSTEESFPATPEPLATPPERGFSLDQVLSAATDAGIDRRHVYVALAESNLPDAVESRRDHWTARWVRSLTRQGDALEVSQVVEAPAARTLSAFDSVVSIPAFHLVQENRLGPAPPLDGVVVYRIEASSGFGASFHGAMHLADARVLLLTARDQGERTVLHLRAPYFDHGVNLAVAGGMTGILGAAGGAGGSATGSALVAALGATSPILASAPAVLGVGVGGALGVAGFRQLCGWGRRKGETALRRLLQAVALEAERTALEDEA